MEVESAIDEVHFTRLLHRCDTWLFLLAIPGKSLPHIQSVDIRVTSVSIL